LGLGFGIAAWATNPRDVAPRKRPIVVLKNVVLRMGGFTVV
jgi:hypothetical protein